jgi:anaerobic selenocysteine-containing dehydrogenase
VGLPPVEIPEDRFVVATRRGRQFNSMVHDRSDEITGTVREAVLMNREDAGRLGLRDGDRVLLSNEFGRFSGHVCIAPVRPRNLEVHWPEGEILIDRKRRSPQAGIPDYNAFVSVEKTPGEEREVVAA